MVESLYFVPEWFYMFDITLGILFSCITAIVSSYSLHIYNIAKEREFKLFSIAFACLSASYFLRTGLNIFLTKIFNEAQGVLYIVDINLFSKAFIYSYVMLFIIGYLTLFYTTIKIKGARIYAILLVISMIAIRYSMNKSLTIYLIATVLIISTLFHYVRLWVESRKKRGKVMMIAIFLLLVSNILLMFISDYKLYPGYIISNLLELIAYLMISYRLYNIIQNGQKKK